MNKKIINILSKVGMVFASLYFLFLIVPFLLLPILNTISSKVAYEIEHLTGFKTEFNKFRIITTPKLTVGAKLGNAKIFQPNGQLLLDADNMQIKMSLLPLLVKKIELDIISAEKINLNLVVKKDGKLLLEDYFKNSTSSNQIEATQNVQSEPFVMPFGFKLSNHLPDFKLKSHNITFIENKSGKKYSITGINTNLTDLIVNKHFKLTSIGSINLDGFEAFKYDLKLFNKIMPDIDLNDLLTVQNQTTPAKTTNNANAISFNIIEIFKLIKNNKFKGELLSDISIDGNLDNLILDGNFSLHNLSMLSNGKALPNSNFDLKFSGNKIDIDSNFNSAQNENTQILGFINIGSNKKIDITCKSNATLKSIFEIANTVAQIVGINDLKTLKAQGQLDINFNIKSDLKKVESNGYFKLLNGLIAYGLYDVKIQDLVSDIKLDNNTVLINKLGFSTLNVPFNVSGKISPNATSDIKIQTNNLSLKGLLISLGQASLLKETPIYNGLVTVSINIQDKLFAPKVSGNVRLQNIDLKNIPADLRLTINPVDIKLDTTKTGFSGSINANGLKVVNPAVSLTADKIAANINEKQIEILDTIVYLGKNKLTLFGSISDYLTSKINFNLATKGELNSKLTGYINPYDMLLALNYSIPNVSKIIIPGFDKSIVKVKGSVDIQDSLFNPVLKGSFDIPIVEIPEIPVSISGMTANLNGVILNGNAVVSQFASGGIKAQNAKSDFELRGNDFYLKNLTGSAFDGTFDGNIVYNLASTKCDVKFNGKNMSALKAVEGAAGIKNALTGTLKFNADVNFKGIEYNDMMKALKGKAIFEINNGILANLGGLKTFLNAQNIVQNTFLKSSTENKTALNTVSKASEFDYIKGELSFDNSYAILKAIDIQGPMMSYHVTGKFNLINATTNAIVIGRLSKEIVGGLGQVGNFAAEKLTSFVPQLGSLTTSIAKSMNVSPKDVDTTKIPKLSSNTTEFREFKVEFNGGVDSNSSVKSFKWINDIDTTQLNQTQSTSIQNQINQTKSAVQGALSDVKSLSKQTKDDINQTKEQAKQLFKSLITIP